MKNKNTSSTLVLARCIFVNEKGDLLILKDKDKEYWGLPGGHVEAGESPKRGLLRELKEEITLVPKKLSFIGLEYLKREGQEERDELIFMFYGGLLTLEEIQVANEIGEAHFMPFENACALLTSTMTRRLRKMFPVKERGFVFLENGEEI